MRIVRCAVVPVGSGRAALFLVAREQIYPGPAAAFLRQVSHIHPYLGRILVSPRVHGFSHTYAQFDYRGAPAINTDEIAWTEHDLDLPPDTDDPPF